MSDHVKVTQRGTVISTLTGKCVPFMLKHADRSYFRRSEQLKLNWNGDLKDLVSACSLVILECLFLFCVLQIWSRMASLKTRSFTGLLQKCPNSINTKTVRVENKTDAACFVWMQRVILIVCEC